MSTPSEALALVQELMACYPQATISPANVQAYARHLGDLPHELLAAAVQRAVATSRFFPSIAELRSAAAALVDDAPQADEAWAIVMREVSRIGRTGKPDLQHDRIRNAVQAIGGWYELCQSEMMQADRAAFFRAYDAATKRATERVTLAAVPALPEASRLMLASGSEVTA